MSFLEAILPKEASLWEPGDSEEDDDHDEEREDREEVRDGEDAEV